MDWFSVASLPRAQFALAASFHFLFLPLTLGLSLLVALLQTRHYRGGGDVYDHAARFWGRFLLLAFSLTAVTGLALLFQIGTGWARFSAYAGAVIGPLLTLWGLLIFLPEAAGLALWHHGRDRLSPKLRLAAVWLAALAANLAPLPLLLAAGWLQQPRPGLIFKAAAVPLEPTGLQGLPGLPETAELADFTALFTNPCGWGQFVHFLLAAWLLSGFFTLGLAALRLLYRRGRDAAPETARDVFRRSVRLAAPLTLAAALCLPVSGYVQARLAAEAQPAKLAALAAHWESRPRAPFHLIVRPDETAAANAFTALSLPGGLSFLAHGDFESVVPGLADFRPADRPAVPLTAFSFRLMAALSAVFIVLSALTVLFRNSLSKRRWLRRWLVFNLPLPYFGLAAGWIVSEAGRQPWLVNQVLRTGQGLSPWPEGAAWAAVLSLAAFLAVYALLGFAALRLACKFAVAGLASRRAGGKTPGGAGGAERVARAEPMERADWNGGGAAAEKSGGAA